MGCCAQRFRKPCADRDQPQSFPDEFVFRHNRRKHPIVAFQTLLGPGTKHKSMTYKDMRSKPPVPRHRSKADPNILGLAETTG
jgi:hypothetical protein